MNQNIKPLTAFIVLLFFGGLLWGKFWANGVALSVFTFSHMHKHPDGTAYIMLDNQLYGFNEQAQPTGKIDLSRLGIESGSAITDFAFFANGDLLIHRSFKPFEFVHSLQRYFRFENQQNTLSPDATDGLHRCNLATYQCQAFSQPAINLNDTFTLAIDWQTDHVFIADTSRSVLYFYTGSGQKLDSKDGFYFPNQIQFQDNQLYVADTNHHSLVTVGIDGNRFGQIQNSLDTDVHPYRKEGDVWPSAFLLTENQRWVRNADNNMEYGGVYIFKTNGEFVKRLNLPKGADLFSLLQLGNAVLVNDFDLGKIYQFSLDGEALPDFPTAVFQPLLDELQVKKQRYRNLDLGFTVAFALSFLVGVGLALFQQSPSNQQMPEPDIISVVPDNLAGQQIYWLKFRFMFKISLVIMVLWVTFAWGLMMYVNCYLGKQSLMDFFIQNFSIFFVFIFFIFFMFLQLRRKIGISEKYFIIVPAFGKAVVCPKEQILYSNLAAVVGGLALNLAQLPKMFTKTDIADWIYPAIKQGRYLDNTELQSILLKKKSTQAIVIVAVIMLMAMFLYLGIKTEKIL